jgi:hypothetical protein
LDYMRNLVNEQLQPYSKTPNEIMQLRSTWANALLDSLATTQPSAA